MLHLLTRIFGSSNQRKLRRFQATVEAINGYEPAMESLSDEALRAKTEEFRARLSRGEKLRDLIPESFAAVREAGKRSLGLRAFDVQLLGGLVLHEGRIAEMKTGEGKTLVATFAIYLNALEGKGAHVVTVNDYLARRDAEWMGPVYEALGMSVGFITANMHDTDRRAAYACDVTYGTNNELGFDYLRDNMKFHLDEMVQREFHYAIVDEVDSILIDEARTPLIISGPAQDTSELYVAIDAIIPHLNEGDFELDEKMRTVTLTDTGSEHVEQLLREAELLKEGALYDAQNIALVHHTNQALRAHMLFNRDDHYIVKDNQVVLIDEFTGRMMEGRRFSEGLHQALEAKEDVQIQQENQTLASITFQNFFRLYPKLAGMTGTAMTEAGEFQEIYNLEVAEIPTNVPVQRADYDDKIYKSLMEKTDAAVTLIADCYKRGQPALVGTTSIEKSETLSEELRRKKIPHQVLNARYHEKEAQIIAQAGRTGAITIATNMAGRGTDIKLGGNLEMRLEEEIDSSWPAERQDKRRQEIAEEYEEEKRRVIEAGGLFVIGTERHESRRIDNQLRGRSGRQGDPGASMFFLSLEDDLMRIFGSDKMQGLMAHKHIGLKEGEPLSHRWISKALERAQGKVEAMNFEMRRNLLKFDDVMNAQRTVIYDQRREVMASEDISELIEEMRDDVIADIVGQTIPAGSYPEQWDADSLQREVQRLFGMELAIRDWAAEEGIAEEEIAERIRRAADDKHAQKVATAGPEVMRRVEKSIVLQILDQLWTEHLLTLDHMRHSINLRAYAQRDPLNEYKAEAFEAFESMLGRLREMVTQTLYLLNVSIRTEEPDLPHGRGHRRNLQETRSDPALETVRKPVNGESIFAGQSSRAERPPFDPQNPETWGKVQRNALCPCGSGKKYKHCHGKIVSAVAEA